MSVWIFSILFFVYFVYRWQGEFVYQSRASLDGDHVHYFSDLNLRFRGDIIWRDYMLVTYRGQRFKVIPPYLFTLIKLTLPKSSLAWGCTVWISVAFSMVHLTTIRAKWSISIWLIGQDLKNTAVCDTYSVALFHLSKECYRWKQA